jgi:hypothetical protein
MRVLREMTGIAVRSERTAARSPTPYYRSCGVSAFACHSPVIYLMKYELLVVSHCIRHPPWP